MQKQVNIREIARRCGVAPATVSRAISGKAPVRAETRAKIEAAIRETGYQTRQETLRQETGHTKTIGVFVPLLNHAFFQRILDQLHLDRIDAGDLLLLGLLYFLFREKADEELLVALGLLLIL